ncbi:uncharacterized protein LOC134726605 [Mytilus trossulus]|uniref:uncharacterized protein LOC134726605 n=1 Tax=Mytilus trossulus TaxID=6551 RepID=UPI003005D5DF
MAMSLPQGQCPIQCQLCEGDPKVNWKCLDCGLFMCRTCKDKVHSKFKSEKKHIIVDIKEVGRRDIKENKQGSVVRQQDKVVSIFGQRNDEVSNSSTNVKLMNIKEYQTNTIFMNTLAVSLNDSLWVGDGYKKGFDPLTLPTALQNFKLKGDKVKVKSSFNIDVSDIAVSPNNDLLLAIQEPRLKQIKAGSRKITDSVFCAESSNLFSVHVTKDGTVIAGGTKIVIVMDTEGNHLTRYENDKNNTPLFEGTIWSITSTLYGNIFVIEFIDNPRVVVLGKSDLISIYTGHPSINITDRFHPMSIVTTPLDNVIMADCDNHTLHILDNTGHLLTIYDTMDIHIRYPRSLAINSTEGPVAELYLGCLHGRKLYKMSIIGY